MKISASGGALAGADYFALRNGVADSANGRDQFGAGNRFIAPMAADGKVFIASTTGVGVFRLLP